MALTASSTWVADKYVPVSAPLRHPHVPSPISPGFSAPQIPTQIVFGPVALAASIARTGLLANAPVEMIARWSRRALEEVEFLVEDGRAFTLTNSVTQLSDSERVLFASRVGAGTTDLLMNLLGYVWRDNAALLTASTNPHADFIYGGGNALGHGVVLAEAHGSFDSKISVATIRRRASAKYLRQVKPSLARHWMRDLIVHGYSVAFGSRVGSKGAFLGVSETDTSQSRVPGGLASAGAPVSSALALSTYRTNFALMGAGQVSRWIDWVRSQSDSVVDSESARGVVFLRFRYSGINFLAPIAAFWPYFSFDLPFWPELWHRYLWSIYSDDENLAHRPRRNFAGWFAIEEGIAEKFLNLLSSLISKRAEIPFEFELPSVQPIGFSFADESDAFRDRVSVPDYSFAMFRDGLALMGTPAPREANAVRTWNPKIGLGNAERVTP